MYERPSRDGRRRARAGAGAFVDPHVHLRTPGREDEGGRIVTGTAAAAAGSYCAILAMPNTEPSSTPPTAARAALAGWRKKPSLGGLFRRSNAHRSAGGEAAERRWASWPTPARPRSPTTAARRDTRAGCGGGSSTTRTRHRELAPNCEEPTLTKGGRPHIGTASRPTGSRRLAVAPARASASRASCRSPPTRGSRCSLMHLSARESADCCGGRWPRAWPRAARVTPHHLCLTDEAVRSLDSNLKMNPPLRSADDRAAPSAS